MVPEKVGLKGVTREGLDYEFTIVLELDLKHQATATKDRTQLFMDKPSFIITLKLVKLFLIGEVVAEINDISILTVRTLKV